MQHELEYVRRNVSEQYLDDAAAGSTTRASRCEPLRAFSTCICSRLVPPPLLRRTSSPPLLALAAATGSKVSLGPPPGPPPRPLTRSIGGSLTPARHHPPAAAAGSEERRPAAVTAATAASAVATAATTVAVATAAPFASSWDAAARGASRLRVTVAGTETSTRPPSTSPKIYRGRQRTHTPLRLKLTIGALPFAWKAVCDGVADR